ncbi:MAG: two pore domain potassium channel family protein [Frankiales bacterium]|nr:two pore domain potassium channel family protein [Frankiales bacterium]
MRALAPVLGALLVGLVAVDAFRTVLLPTSSGGLSQVLSLGLWRAGRLLPQRVRLPVLRVTGPLALVLTVASWLALLLLAFALVYLPAVDGLAFSDQYRPASPGFGTALYLSGVSLTTIGFGDVVGGSLPVRALTVVEAGAGLGVLTAALGYLPTIYTLVSELRTNNQAVADLAVEDVGGASELLSVDAALVLDAVRRDLLSARQHLQRFPVLHYFHPPYDESVVALTRGGLGLWVAAHFADDQQRPLPRHVKALEQALRRMSDAMLAHGGKSHDGGDLARAGRTFERARQASAHPDAAREGEATEDAVALLAEVHAVLDAYALRHDYPESDQP